MSTAVNSRLSRKRNRRIKPLLPLAIILLAAAAVHCYPAFIRQPLNATPDVRIYYMGTAHEGKAVIREGQAYLPLDFLQKFIDPDIGYDEKNQMVIITTQENVFHFPLGVQEGLLNLEPYSFTYPAIQDQGTVYLPADPLNSYYNLEIMVDHKESIIRVSDSQQPIQQGVTLTNGRARLRPAFPSPWLAQFASNEEVSILREEKGWYWVEAPDGRMGYLNKKSIGLTGIRIPLREKSLYQPWNPLGEQIILTWEVAGNSTVNPQTLGDLPGVNVFSPTWFHLKPDGVVVNKADSRYVRWAHDRGSQVWGLFDNSFDPDLTHTFLNDTKLRIKAIKQILSYVDLYELDGINIDFENIRLQDKEAFVRFIRELAPLLHEKERTLTVDVTFHSLSENWSMCYDRKALAESADYLVVMAYDEHGQGSREAGSVSSLPWVEQGIRKILAEVPPDKVLLGIPFYTRLWTEEITPDGQKKVTSKALSMDKASQWIKEQQAEIRIDQEAGQHYVEHKEGKITRRMWLEDSFSLEKRVELQKKYRLAGLAAWRRGFENDQTWDFISALTNKRW